ncbi:MAG: AmmeMemoRadiSam system protein B [Deltaproteobacteria bacterium]|nr:MAG: AmmeMemoRadiSam system protein B [Deltaproteobacteria bacterium]
MIRKPSVAHQFYPGDKNKLAREIESYTTKEAKKEDVLGLVAPHAGYMYSGMVAGSVYSVVNIPDNVVVLSPNHTGLGSRAAVMSEGAWQMPTGDVGINPSLSRLIMEQSKYLEEDEQAHLREHSLEVQLPFLQYFNPDFQMVPICLAGRDMKFCQDIGLAVARALKEFGQPVLIVASSDMTHYESQRVAKRKDEMAIEKILSLDPPGLLEIVRKESISMCGVIPTTVMLIACKELGAKEARLVKYATSGDVSGDYDQVVGYAGITVK